MHSVFFISGFDPRGVKHYHKLLTEELTKYNVSRVDYQITVTKPEPLKEDHFIYRSRVLKDNKVIRNYHFLNWSDLATTRKQKKWEIFFDLVLTSFYIKPNYIKFLKFSIQKKPFNKLYFLGTLFFFLVKLLLLSLILGVITFFIPFAKYFSIFSLVVAFIISTYFFLAFIFIPNYSWFVSGVLQVYVQKNELLLSKRIKNFESHLFTFIKSAGSNDEILIASHSHGANLAIKIFSELANRLDKNELSKVKLLTMGCFVYPDDFYKNACKYKASISNLLDKNVNWLNVEFNQDPLSSEIIKNYAQNNDLSNFKNHMIVLACWPSYLKIENKGEGAILLAHFIFFKTGLDLNNFDYVRLLCE